MNPSLLAEKEWRCYLEDTEHTNGCSLCDGLKKEDATANERLIAMMMLENQDRMELKSFCWFLEDSQYWCDLNRSQLSSYYLSHFSEREGTLGRFPFKELGGCEEGDDVFSTVGENVSYRVVGWILMEAMSEKSRKSESLERLGNDQIIAVLQAGAARSKSVSVVASFLLPFFMMRRRPSKELVQSLGLTLLKHAQSPLATIGWACLGTLWWRISDAMPVAKVLAQKAFEIAIHKALSNRVADVLKSCLNMLNASIKDPTYFINPNSCEYLDFPYFPDTMVNVYRSLLIQKDYESLEEIIKNTPRWLIENTAYFNLTYIVARICLADNKVAQALKNSGVKDSKSLKTGGVYILAAERAALQQIYINILSEIHAFIQRRKDAEIEKLESRHLEFTLLLRCKVLETLRDTLGHQPSIQQSRYSYGELLECITDRPTSNDEELIGRMLICINALCAMSLDVSQRSAAKLNTVVKIGEELITKLSPVDSQDLTKRYTGQNTDTPDAETSIPLSEVIGCLLKAQISVARGYYSFFVMNEINQADKHFKHANVILGNQLIDAYLMRIWALSKLDPHLSWDSQVLSRNWAIGSIDSMLKNSFAARRTGNDGRQSSFEFSLLNLSKHALVLLPGSQQAITSAEARKYPNDPDRAAKAARAIQQQTLESKTRSKDMLSRSDKLYLNYLSPLRFLIDAHNSVLSLENRISRAAGGDKAAKSGYLQSAQSILTMVASSAFLNDGFNTAHIQYLSRLTILLGNKEAGRIAKIPGGITLQQSSIWREIEHYLGVFNKFVTVDSLPADFTQIRLGALISLLGTCHDFRGGEREPFMRALLSRRFTFVDKWNARKLRKSSEGWESRCPYCHLQIILVSIYLKQYERYNEDQIMGQCQYRGQSQLCILASAMMSSLEELEQRRDLQQSSHSVRVGEWPMHEINPRLRPIEIIEESWENAE